MKILLDECVPWPMRKMLANHECSNPFRYGWNGVTNGEFLKLAENEFELFITADQNLRYQQNLSGRRIAILELSTNDLRRILAAEALIVEAVASIKGARIPATGDSRVMNDTSPEIAAMVHARLMAKTGEERFLMGIRMHEAARRMVMASFSPRDSRTRSARSYSSSDSTAVIFPRLPTGPAQTNRFWRKPARPRLIDPQLPQRLAVSGVPKRKPLGCRKTPTSTPRSAIATRIEGTTEAETRRVEHRRETITQRRARGSRRLAAMLQIF